MIQHERRFPSYLLAVLQPVMALGVLSAVAAQPPAVGTEGLAAGADGAGLLAQRCVSCHNPSKLAGGVDLSTFAAATRARAGGPALAAGRVEASRLFQLAAAGRMPPTGRLPVAEVARLRRWIAAGAPYPAAPLTTPAAATTPLWSLRPVRRSAVPRTPFDSLARNPVDRFVFSALAQLELRPSPPAGQLELLRRVTIDLTGLPPTPGEVEAYLSDRSLDAYEKVVDRLLASPAYGERWARHWLDIVRFGESQGYEQNHLRPNAWPYRDYVIHALNRDLPYSQFVTEQLAGDVLGRVREMGLSLPVSPDCQAATGFLVAGVHDTVGNQTEEGRRQQRANDLDDIVATTGAAFLGLTVGCARCHDHKFDPVPQTDYYRLAAVFAGVQHGEQPLDLSGGRDQRRGGMDGDRSLVNLLATIHSLEGQLAAIEARGREAVLRGQGETAVPRPAVNPRRNVEEFAPVAARFVRLTVEATRDGAEPCIDEIEVFGPGGEANLALAPGGATAAASSLLPGYPIHQVAHLNDGRWGNDWSWISQEPGRGWAQIELPAIAPVNRVVWSRDGSVEPRFSDRLASAYRVELSLDGRRWQEAASNRDRAPAPEAIPPDRLVAALSPADRDRRAARAQELDSQRRLLISQSNGRGPQPVYAGRFVAPEPVFLLRRGDVMQRADPMPPGALSAIDGLDANLGLPATAGDAARRVALSRWITDPRNPLTPRVIVNRIWQYHFGRGLVPTPSDFGRNGEPPSHPELLDWLAAGLVSGNWSTGEPRDGIPRTTGKAVGAATAANSPVPSQAWRLKPLHRLLVTSFAYRQSSGARAPGMAVDAGNRYLWRMPLRRMEAEAIRDSILAVSGKLDRRMGGPGFLLYRYRVVNVAIYDSLDECGPETWRRGVYSQAARSIRDDLLGSFDCPESAQRMPRRDSTTTPLQALALLNGSFILQQAAFMAERVEREATTHPTLPANTPNHPGTDPPSRQDSARPEVAIRRAFELAFGRPPGLAESRQAASLVRSRGLAALCRALLNANEFLYY